MMLDKDPALFSNFIEKKKAQYKEYKNHHSSPDSLKRRIGELAEGKRTVYLEEGKGFIIEVETIKPSHAQPFEVVQKKVAEDYYHDQAVQALKNDMKEAEKIMPNSKDLEKSFSIKIEKLKKITAQADVSSLTQKGIPLQFFKLTQPLTFKSVVTPEGGFMVLLETIDPFNEALFAEHQKDIKKQLMQEHMALFMSSFIASLEKNATIKVNFSGLKK
jgi:hypothetical protein